MKSRPSTPIDPTLQASSAANITISPRRKAAGSTPAIEASSSSSYLSRKAHRFSSLKRQKKPSGLIQHLFGPPQEDMEVENGRDPPPTDSVDEEDLSGAGCVRFAFSEAVSSLRLDHEASVRETIQQSMLEAQATIIDAKALVMEVVCSPALEQTADKAFFQPVTADDAIKTSIDSPSERSQAKSPLLPPLQHPKYALGSVSSDSPPKEKPVSPKTVAVDAPSSSPLPSPRHKQLSLLASNEDEDSDDDEANKPMTPKLQPQVSSGSSWDEDARPTKLLAEVSTSPEAHCRETMMSSSRHEDAPAESTHSLRKASEEIVAPSLSPTRMPTFLAPSATEVDVPQSPSQTSTYLAPIGAIPSVTMIRTPIDDEAFLPDDFLPGGNASYTSDLVSQLRLDQAVASAKLDWQIDQERSVKDREENLRDQHEQEIMALHKQVLELQDAQKDWEAEHNAALREAKQQWDQESAVALELSLQERLQTELERAKKDWEQEMTPNQDLLLQERLHEELAAAMQLWEQNSAENLTRQLDLAKKEWEQEILSKQEERLQKEIEVAVSECRSAEICVKEELETEIHRLQRKINEQKDQTLMAKQLAKQHQLEMEQMEAKLTELNQQTDQVSKLQLHIEELRRERDEKVSMLAQQVKDAKEQNQNELAILQEQLAEKSNELELATQSKFQLEKDREQQVAHIRKMQGVLGRALSPSKGSRRSENEASSPKSDTKHNFANEEVTKLRLQLDELKASKEALAQKYEGEMEVLQNQMTEAKVMDAVEIESLKMQLEALQESKQRELEASLRALKAMELELKQAKEAQINDTDKQKHSDAESASKVKDRDSSAATRSPPRHSTESLTKAKQDLVTLRREMDQLKKEKEAEISDLQKQLKAVKERINEAPLAESSPARRQSIPGRSTPSRIPHRSGRKDSLGTEVQERELHEREKEVLRQHIGVLEDQVRKMSTEHESALGELRKRSEKDLVRIKKEMELRVEKHMRAERELKDSLATVDSADKEELLEKIERLEEEKKSERSGGLREVQKKEDLLQKISALEKRERDLLKEQEIAMQEIREQSDLEIHRLQKEIERQRNESQEKERKLERAIVETQSFEKEELLQRVDKLERLLENERSGAVLVKMKVSCLEKEAKAAEVAHQEEVESIRSSLESKIQTLTEELEGLRAVELEMQRTSHARDALDEKLQGLTSKLEECLRQHQTELGRARQSHAEELDRHRRHSAEQMVKLERDARNRIAALEGEMDLLRDQVAAAASTATTPGGLSAEEATALRDDVASAQALLEAERRRFDDTLRTSKAEFLKDHNRMQREFNDKLKQIKAEHAKEKEAILTRFSKAEADHRTKVSEIQKSAGEKDAIITALGSQLADAQTRSKKAEENLRSLSDKLDASRKESTQAYAEVGKLKHELEALTEKHEAFEKEVEAAREEACEEAREEMIERAEVQFKQANELYVKLKKQYDLCKRKVEGLESDLRKTKQALTEQESSHTELEAQVASLRGENAQVVSEAARKGKEYRREMERLLQAAEDFERKCKASEATSRHAYKKLAVAMEEKEKLQKEYDEVKNVCEELMAMVEGGQQQHQQRREQRHHEC